MTDALLWRRIENMRWLLPMTETRRLAHPTLQSFAKMECADPSGSVKDRAAYWVLREAIRRGEITRHSIVVESSSGNCALSMAFFCARPGIRFIPGRRHSLGRGLLPADLKGTTLATRAAVWTSLPADEEGLVSWLHARCKEDPVQAGPGDGGWHVLGYQEAVDVLSDHVAFSNAVMADLPQGSAFTASRLLDLRLIFGASELSFTADWKAGAPAHAR